MNCYVFEHPQYGKLRMVERRDGELYYYLEDVMRIFSKNGAKTFGIIANSEGEVVTFGFVLVPPKKGETYFFTERELGVVRKRQKNFRADKNFIDEQLLHDMQGELDPEGLLAKKWVNIYVPRVLASEAFVIGHEAKGVQECCEYGLLSPMDIRYTKYGLYINTEYLEI